MLQAYLCWCIFTVVIQSRVMLWAAVEHNHADDGHQCKEIVSTPSTVYVLEIKHILHGRDPQFTTLYHEMSNYSKQSNKLGLALQSLSSPLHKSTPCSFVVMKLGTYIAWCEPNQIKYQDTSRDMETAWTRQPVPRSRWPLTHESSPEARNSIWLPVAHYDEKLDIQHTNTSQWLKCKWLKMYDAFFKRLSAHELKHRFFLWWWISARKHTRCTWSHFGIFEQKLKKHESTFTTFRFAPSGF